MASSVDASPKVAELVMVFCAMAIATHAAGGGGGAVGGCGGGGGGIWFTMKGGGGEGGRGGGGGAAGVARSGSLGHLTSAVKSTKNPKM